VLDQLFHRHRHGVLHQRRPGQADDDDDAHGQRLPESLDWRHESDYEQAAGGHGCGGEDGGAGLGRVVLGELLRGAEVGVDMKWVVVVRGSGMSKKQTTNPKKKGGISGKSEKHQ
jgi:hypothetical protein